MVWLSIVSLTAGAVVAQRFKILALMPVSLVVVIVAVEAGAAQQNGGWGTILTIAAVTGGIQAGYLIGALIQNRLTNRSSACFPTRVGAGYR